MQIPSFDHNFVLPPFVGNSLQIENVSPYLSNTFELCTRFATSIQRKEILIGYLSFRKKLNEFGIIYGFQWLDGSFLENIEKIENRAPNDLDLITFFISTGLNFQLISESFNEFLSSVESKQMYKLDHYNVQLDIDPQTLVELVNYWSQLFSHNRKNVRKGMIKISLNTPEIDEEAFEYLNSLNYE